MSTEVLSVRIRRELKKEAERLNIDVKRVVEEALEEKIKEEKLKRLREALKKFREFIGMDRDEWVRLVREERESR
ncbi:MAG: DUF4145 domain-containing protein [Candidatus Korarchaeota archaeon]|nr:DUF4145 domain-containing protein [Candidatus Korarchaeota archaeon]